MDLLQNPFHILQVNSRDNRRRILELTDERSLLFDANACMNACSVLTNPKKRLAAELAWLPGIRPPVADKVVRVIQSSPKHVFAIKQMPSLAWLNTLVAALARLPESTDTELTAWILKIAEIFENLDPKKLQSLINEERIVSCFPEVSDLSIIDDEIQQRRRYYSKVIKAALNKRPSQELVQIVTNIVETATDYGTEHGPTLIVDLVEGYEVEAQNFLNTEEANIDLLVEKLLKVMSVTHEDSIIDNFVAQLILVVKNWDTVAQPIQLSTRGRGLAHPASQRIAKKVRTLAIYMFNEHNALEYAQRLTHMLQEVFEEVESMAEQLAEDAEALDEIASQQLHLAENIGKQAQEWEKEISYEATVGLLFKEPLRISPKGVEWKGKCWPLESITRIRWGATRHSVNGISTGTNYTIFLGTPSNSTTIKLKRASTFSSFINCLWRSVGVRLLVEYLKGLQSGQTYRFGSAIIRDRGMDLQSKSFFGSGEIIFCPWAELVTWQENGCLCIGSSSNRKLREVFSYQGEDNIHVIAAALELLKSKGDGLKLSSILGG